MKKIFTALLVSFIGTSSMASAKDSTKPTAHFEMMAEGQNSSMYLVTDITIGCQYLVYIHANGVTMIPRLRKNGNPMCIDTSKPEAESFK